MPTRMKKRYCRVEYNIGSSGGFVDISGLSIKFEIKKTIGSVMNEATIEIDGLSTPTLENLTTTVSQVFNPSGTKPVLKITAGYVNEESILFEGELYEAIAGARPRRTLTCQGKTGFSNKGTQASFSIDNTKLHTVAKSIAEQAGIAYIFDEGTNIGIENYTYSGNLYDAVIGLGSYGRGITAYVEDNVLRIIKDTTTPSTSSSVISSDTGMIGLPQITQTGVIVRYRMNAFVKCNSSIRVISQIIPLASGLYTVIKITHKGDLLGNDWYTEVECRREGD